MRKKLSLCVPLFFLAGCAQQKQQMPDANYEMFAKVEVASDACLKSNFITAQEAGQAHSNISLFLSSWAYDYVRYSNILAQGHEELKKIKITQEGCNLLRAKIYQYNIEVQRYQKQMEMAAQQKALADQQALQSIQNMQNTLPKTTYCNQIGTQTICNSY